MPLKIMCAGCSKDERDSAEAAVKAALGTAPGSWMVSLVKIGRRWSVTVDGPEVKHKTVVVPDGAIPQALRDLVPPPTAPGPAPWPAAPAPLTPPRGISALKPGVPSPAPRAPLPPTTITPPARPKVPSLDATPVPKRTPPPERPVIPEVPTTPPGTPRVTLPAGRPGASTLVRPPGAAARTPSGGAGRAPVPPRSTPTGRGGVHHDRYECQFCGGAFVVIYESPADSSQETVAVACPHCWKNNHVMISEEAALSRDYRAEKA
jgi:hypothetical protein